MFGKCFVNHNIELADFCVGSNLSIPTSMLMFNKPAAKCGERLVVEMLNLIFNQSNV